MGRDLRADLVAEYSKYEPIYQDLATYEEYQTGIRALYNMTGRLSIRSGVYYRLIDGGTYNYDSLVFLNQLNLKLTPTVEASLMHQFQEMALTTGENHWRENLLILTVRKTF